MTTRFRENPEDLAGAFSCYYSALTLLTNSSPAF